MRRRALAFVLLVLDVLDVVDSLVDLLHVLRSDVVATLGAREDTARRQELDGVAQRRALAHRAERGQAILIDFDVLRRGAN